MSLSCCRVSSHGTAARCCLLPAALLLSLSQADGADNFAGSANPSGPATILVNSPAARPPEAGGRTTLAEAVRQAAGDPRDNLITFDSAVFAAGPHTVPLAGPLVVGSAAGGHDRIDGGSCGGTIIIDLAACPDAGVIVSGGGQLTLAGLTLRGGNKRAVLVRDDGCLDGRQVTVQESGGPGIALFGRGRVNLTGCQIEGNETHGLELHDQAAAVVNNSELSANRQSAIAVFNQASCLADDCRLTNNGEWNLVLGHSGRAQLSRCRLSGSRFAGVDISGKAHLFASDCAFEGGRRFGIFATEQGQVELIGAQISRSGGRGIELQNRASLAMAASRVERGADYGLILFGDSNVEAVNSTFAANGAHGVCLRDQAGGRFQECTFTGNRYSGIGCLDGSGGGTVVLSQCVFRQNGMRPIYRGPLHIDPLTPTPQRINGNMVEVLADPQARIELYLDRVGEAAQYFKTIHADRQGRFSVDRRQIPAGYVLTASATSRAGTSEFNVIAGADAAAVVNALLAKSGPYSDEGRELSRVDMSLRRWKPGTHLLLHIENPPSPAIERYAQFLARQIPTWTQGAVTAEIRLGEADPSAASAVVIPVRYMPPGDAQLMDRGGVIFMKWDPSGHFRVPMKIVLATGEDAEQTCPRVLAHEVGHALGLSHARVGLLSRMQGSTPPDNGFVNDFSPIMTFYDVLALQLLYDPAN